MGFTFQCGELNNKIRKVYSKLEGDMYSGRKSRREGDWKYRGKEGKTCGTKQYDISRPPSLEVRFEQS